MSCGARVRATQFPNAWQCLEQLTRVSSFMHAAREFLIDLHRSSENHAIVCVAVAHLLAGCSGADSHYEQEPLGRVEMLDISAQEMTAEVKTAAGVRRPLRQQASSSCWVGSRGCTRRKTHNLCAAPRGTACTHVAALRAPIPCRVAIHAH
jgi:hypothetical protein